jgi:peptidoglycan/xylan/chitin deacetylase (PgdA/CDA1 family)
MKLLKKIFKKIRYKVVSELKLGPLLQNINSISVLTYHGIIKNDSNVNDYCFVSEVEFEKQVKYLSENFELRSAEDAYLNYYDNKKPVAVITFDDGFLNNFTYALPILKKYLAPATVFLSTKYIDTIDTIWFCKIIHAVEICNDEKIEWRGEVLPIQTKGDKMLTSTIIQNDLKGLHPLTIDTEINGLVESINNISDFSNTPFEMLTSKTVIEMQESNLITFGAHTHTHAILSKLDEAESKVEIFKSLDSVKKITGKKCNMFAYPNGGISDYNDSHKLLLKNSSISLAFSMIDGLSSKQDDLYQIKRFFISSHINIKQFSAQVHGY